MFPQPNGPRVQGIKGLLRAPRSRDSRDNGLLGTWRSIGLKVPRAKRVFPKFNGEGFGIPIINVSTLFQEFTGLKGHTTSRVLNIKGFFFFFGVEGLPGLTKAVYGLVFP